MIPEWRIARLSRSSLHANLTTLKLLAIVNLTDATVQVFQYLEESNAVKNVINFHHI